jgi:polygalacturonase
MRRRDFLHAGVLVPLAAPFHAFAAASTYNVREFGAKGDGKTLDTAAINKAIETAAARGGGTVAFPAGNYLCYTIRLKSNITLFLEQGATMIAADQPRAGQAGYDNFEPNVFGDLVYQDFGHSHWRNSLIWGEQLENISIQGPGRIWGRGLLRDGGTTPGQGNKTIALKLCRNVNLKDFTVYQGGWFVLLATGVDNMTISNIKVDTNRDGFDIDCCRNVRVSDCTINSPLDDAICLKSSYGLGYPRATDNVTITNCQVSGYTMGTLFDGTYQFPANGGGTGRIKFGTESNGGFRNITISNCVFVHCNGLAIESVDGAIIEDVTIDNIAMEHISNPPLFVRLGARMRGPDGIPIGAIRRLNISNVVAAYTSSRAASIISGIPGHAIDDLRLSHIRILYKRRRRRRCRAPLPTADDEADGVPGCPLRRPTPSALSNWKMSIPNRRCSGRCLRMGCTYVTRAAWPWITLTSA